QASAPPGKPKARKQPRVVVDNGAVGGPGPTTVANVAAANVRFQTPPRKMFAAIEEEEEEEEEQQEDEDEEEEDENGEDDDGEDAIRMIDESGPRPRTRSKGKGKA